MKSAESTASFSLLIKIIFAVVKTFIAVISGSVALLAESIHAFTDIISTGLVFLGIRISRYKSKSFPYGLYKVENFVALAVALL
jgi:divalent metal cation (Fe/Co/Zn/Cd) transporter